jgi:hypothetical protein
MHGAKIKKKIFCSVGPGKMATLLIAYCADSKSNNRVLR